MSRRLPSIFDRLPPGDTSPESIELAMDQDLSDRSLAAVERGLAGHPSRAGDTPRPQYGHPGGGAVFDFDPDQPRDATGRFAPDAEAGSGANPTHPPASPLPDSAVRALTPAEAASRTGLSPAQLGGFRSVVTVEQFLRTPPPESKGAVLLGKTRNQPHNLYWHLAATHAMLPWPKTYPQALGPAYRERLDDPDCTARFMDGVFAAPGLKDRPIVFLCPNNILTPGKGKYTREEMEYLLADPARAARTVLVTGCDDYLDAGAARASGKTARGRFDAVRATVVGRMPKGGKPGPAAKPETSPLEIHGDVEAARELPKPPPRGDVSALPPGATAELDKKTATWMAGLDEYPRMAVEGYTGSLFEHINKSLVDSPDDMSSMSEGTRHNIRAIDAAIRAYPPHEKPLTSYRGVRSRHPEKIAKMEAGFRDAMETGEPVKLDGFVSSSLDPFTATGWGSVVLEITSPRGAYLGTASERPTEKEILHTHGDRFRVTGVREANYVVRGVAVVQKRTYSLEAIAEPPAPLPPPASGAEFAFDESQPRDEHGRWASRMGRHDPREPFGESAVRPYSVTFPSDLPPAVIAAAVDWAGSLTPQEREAFRSYTNSAYGDINRKLAAAGGDVNKMKPDPDAGGRDPAVRARLIASGAAKSKPHDPPLTGWRLMALRPERMEDFLSACDAASRDGGTVKMPVYGSTSLNPACAVEWSSPKVCERRYMAKRETVLLEITSRTGLVLGPTNLTSLGESENEILQQPQAKYKVLGWKDVKFGEHARRVLRLEEVPPEPAAAAVAAGQAESPQPPTPAPAPTPPAARPSFWQKLKGSVGFGGFDPDLHPHDERGRWAKASATPSATPGSPSESATVTTSPDSSEPPVMLTAPRPERLPREFMAAGDKWVRALSPVERKALRAYTGSNYGSINAALRRHPDMTDHPDFGPRARNWAVALTAALERAEPHPTPVVSYRGVVSRTAAKLRKLKDGFRLALNEGSTVRLDGFSSSSLDPTLASDWVADHAKDRDGFILEIKSRRGVYVAPGSDNPEESEVLHNHGSQYRVTGSRLVEYRSEGGAWETRLTFTLEHVEGGSGEDVRPSTDDRRMERATPSIESGHSATASLGADPFPPVANYKAGLELAGRVAALPHHVAHAEAAVTASTAAFKQWPKDHPGMDELHPERLALYKHVEAAEQREFDARDADRKSFLAAVRPVAQVEWTPDTSGCSPAGWNRAMFRVALEFSKKLVDRDTGVDPAVIVYDGPGPSYVPAMEDDPEDVGAIRAPGRTSPVAFAHEIGHHVEMTAPGTRELCNEFLNHRAGSEEPADLVAMGLTQVAGAVGVKDDFGRVFPGNRAYYCGRRYVHGGTEILAMGLETLYHDPVGFAKKDPEYFAFVVGVLNGDLTHHARAGHASAT